MRENAGDKVEDNVCVCIYVCTYVYTYIEVSHDYLQKNKRQLAKTYIHTINVSLQRQLRISLRGVLHTYTLAYIHICMHTHTHTINVSLQRQLRI